MLPSPPRSGRPSPCPPARLLLSALRKFTANLVSCLVKETVPRRDREMMEARRPDPHQECTSPSRRRRVAQSHLLCPRRGHVWAVFIVIIPFSVMSLSLVYKHVNSMTQNFIRNHRSLGVPCRPVRLGLRTQRTHMSTCPRLWSWRALTTGDAWS